MSDVTGETYSSCELEKHLGTSGLLLLLLLLCVCVMKSRIVTSASLLPSMQDSWVWCPGLEKVATDGGCVRTKALQRGCWHVCLLYLLVVSAHGPGSKSRPSTGTLSWIRYHDALSHMAKLKEVNLMKVTQRG